MTFELRLAGRHIGIITEVVSCISNIESKSIHELQRN
jgi:hypothetical protein